MIHYKLPVHALLTGTLLFSSVAALADEKDSGKALHDANCRSCHDSSMFTRDDRKMKSLASLRTQVQRCETMLGLGWFDEELDSVTDFLNKNYYHFQ